MSSWSCSSCHEKAFNVWFTGSTATLTGRATSTSVPNAAAHEGTVLCLPISWLQVPEGPFRQRLRQLLLSAGSRSVACTSQVAPTSVAGGVENGSSSNGSCTAGNGIDVNGSGNGSSPLRSTAASANRNGNGAQHHGGPSMFVGPVRLVLTAERSMPDLELPCTVIKVQVSKGPLQHPC